MKTPGTTSDNAPRPSRTRKCWLYALGLFVLCATTAVFSLRNAYPFLAVPTDRVPAEVLVVEGWIYDYCFDAAAAEFQRGHYKWIATSGLEIDEPGATHRSFAHRAAKALEARGVPADKILVCPGGKTDWNRTSSSALAVYRFLESRQELPVGVNVLTIGPHARQSRLAYRRIFGPEINVGIITVPKQGVDTDHWWRSAHGRLMVGKDLAGWFKECLFGHRR